MNTNIKTGKNSDSDKIITLFNKLLNSISKLKEFKFKNKFIKYQSYITQCDILSSYVSSNFFQSYSLKLFRILFEGDKQFKKYTVRKEKIINILIDKIKGKDTESDMKKVINEFLFKIEEDEDDENAHFHKFIKLNNTMNKIGIKNEFIYIYMMYIEEKGISLNNLIEILIPIFKYRFPDTIINLNNNMIDSISFNDFVDKFCQILINAQTLNFLIIEWDNEKNDIITSERVLEEITKIIKDTHDKSTSKNKNLNKIESIPSKIKESKYNNSKNKDYDDKISNKKDSIPELKEEKVNKSNMKENLKNDDDGKKDYNYEKMSQDIKQLLEKDKQKEKQLNDLYKYIDENEKKMNDYKKKIDDLYQIIADKSEIINELEFNIKIIGLRTGFKSLIDLFIYIFKLEDNGNLLDKINSIKDYMNKINNNKSKKIISFIDDTLNLINDANEDAHYIDYNSCLIEQIINSIIEYTEQKEYVEIIEIIKNFKVENEFKELVKVRNQKYKLKNKFKSYEKIIIEKIKNNEGIENGLALLKSNY